MARSGLGSFGIGASEVAHVLANRPLAAVNAREWHHGQGRLRRGSRQGPGRCTYRTDRKTAARQDTRSNTPESAISALPLEAQMTLCNMAIEMGARFGPMCGLTGLPPTGCWNEPLRPRVSCVRRPRPTGLCSRLMLAQHTPARSQLPLPTFARWSHGAPVPKKSVRIDGTVPDGRGGRSGARLYGFCSRGSHWTVSPSTWSSSALARNARLSDLREAAIVLKGARAIVPLTSLAGVHRHWRSGRARGDWQTFSALRVRAGARRGCSLCVGMNGDLVPPGARCASTSNRNFRGRQGPGARTHLMSPAMAAAAAVTGKITDLRRWVWRWRNDSLRARRGHGGCIFRWIVSTPIN